SSSVHLVLSRARRLTGQDKALANPQQTCSAKSTCRLPSSTNAASPAGRKRPSSPQCLTFPVPPARPELARARLGRISSEHRCRLALTAISAPDRRQQGTGGVRHG